MNPLPYVDGFVIPVPKSKLDDYKTMAAVGATVWMEHGALDYKECVLDDDTPCGQTRPFAALAGAAADETVVFAFIVYPSREARDAINAKVMADPRLQACCPEKNPGLVMPFDPARMAYAGFQTLVSA